MRLLESPIFKQLMIYYFWSNFFLFPGLPHSEMLGVAAVIFSPPLRYWMLWKCWSFSRNLLHLVSWAGCASSSRITENRIPGPGESSQNILTAPAIFRSAGRAKVSPGVSGLNCNIVKTERGERGCAGPRLSPECWLALAARAQTRGRGKFHYFI